MLSEKMTIKRLSLAALILVATLQCSNVPVTSIPKISAIDFRTTDLSQLSAVVKIPDAIDMSQTKVTYFTEISSGENSEKYRSVLVPYDGDEQTRRLIEKYQEEGYNMRAYQIPESDLSKIEALRRTGFEWKETYGSSKGYAGVSIDEFCYKRGEELEGLKGTLWVRAEEIGEYVMLLKNLNLSASQMEEEGMSVDEYMCDP